MAKYKAQPQYAVTYGNPGDKKRIQFNMAGEYETEDKTEIAVLDDLCPKYITCVEKTPKKSAVKSKKDTNNKKDEE